MEVIYSFLLTLTFICIGKFFIDRIDLGLSPLEKLVLAFGLGMGLGAYSVFGLGLVHLLYKELVLTLMCLVLFVSRRQLQELFKASRSAARRISAMRWSIFELLMLAVILVQLVVNFLYDLGPVIGWDAPAYYLYVPKIYAQGHGIVYMPSHILAGGPQLIEMVFTALILLCNGVAAVFMNWWIGVFIMAAAYIFARRIVDRAMALMAVAILSCLPEFSYYFCEGKPTLGTHFFGILCVISFIFYLSDRRTGHIVLSAIFGGFAMASSGFSGFVMATIVAIWLVVLFVKRSALALHVRYFFLFSAILALVGAPFYIRNIAITGNPVFPFCYNIFGGKYWNESLYACWKNIFPSRPPNVFYFLKFLLWDYTFSFDGPTVNGRMATPLFLVFIPLMLFLKQAPKMVRHALSFSLLYFVVFYFLSGPQRRYSIVVFPFLALLTVYAIARLNAINAAYRFISCISMAAFVIYGVTVSIRCFLPRANVVFGMESKDAYLSRYYNDYNVLKFANAHIPASSTLLLVGAYGYYCDCNSVRGDYLQGFIQYDVLDTPQKLITRLKEARIDYIVVNNKSGGMLSGSGKRPYDEIAGIKERYLNPVYTENNTDLYKIIYD